MTDRRFLYLLRYYPTLTETFVSREMAALVERGFSVSVASPEARADGGHALAVPGVDLRRPPAWTRRWGWARRRWLAGCTRGFPRVHVHFAGEAGEWALEGRRRFGVEYTVMVHAVDLFKPRPTLGEVLSGARTVLTVSRYNQDLLKARYGVQARLVRCGVAPALRMGRPGEGPFTVLAVGRWVEKKGFDALVRAVEALDVEVRLLLVSDAPRSLESDRVRVLGLQPPSQVEAWMESASLVALPARPAADGDMDGVPVVLMEALARQVPVLTTPVSGIPELVDDAVGWTVPAQELQSALRDAALHPEERVIRGRRGPDRLAERGFTLRDQVEGLLAAWAD